MSRYKFTVSIKAVLLFCLKFSYWGLLLSIFLSIWGFKQINDNFIEAIQLGFATLCWVRKKMQNTTLSPDVSEAIFNGII